MHSNSFLLSGSLAFDKILLHEGQFHQRILPEAIARLNVCFGIERVDNHFGGTAGNIAYSSSLLGDSPLLISSVGDIDGFEYIDRITEVFKIPVDCVAVIKGEHTPSSWIITDTDNNQITAFNSGSMRKFNPFLVLPPSETPDIWLISPENVKTSAMLFKEGVEREKTMLFDPGQALPWYIEGGSDSIMPLTDIVLKAKGLFVNEYEYLLIDNYLSERGVPLIHSDSNFYVKTMGKDGVEVGSRYKSFKVPVATPNAITDPTGCGDSFRAGFMFGFVRNMPLESCALLGAVMGSFTVETSGGQSHVPSIDEINSRFKALAERSGMLEYFFELSRN